MIQVKLLEDCDMVFNDKLYIKGEILNVKELLTVPKSYAYYYGEGYDQKLDWIPKNICEVIS